MSRSGKENYDVLGRELVLEYELRLLRDKKWFPWEHEQYLEARKCGIFNSKEQQEKQKKRWKESERLFVK